MYRLAKVKIPATTRELCNWEHFNLTEISHLLIFNGHDTKKKAIANIVKNILDDLSYCHQCISV